MKKHLLIILSLLFTCINAYPNIYLNGNFGANMEKAPDIDFSDSINLGYNLNKKVALEGGLTFNYNGYSIIDMAMKGTLPLNNIFSLYARAGLASNLYYASNIQSPINSGVGLLLGLGARVNLNRQWSLNIEDYGVTSGPDFLMAGLQFDF